MIHTSSVFRHIRQAIFFIALFTVTLLTGCLSADHKEIRLSLNADGKSGTGKIIFTNIISEPDDSTKDNSKEDFTGALITEYYEGRKIEGTNKGMRNVKKRLYMEDDMLMGEITFDFDDITKLGFYRYKGEGPYMYYTIGDGYF